ncbi:hypothetical protein [Halofilum ochraceum]|uniref:hypothetical protein n=1 Tax=Halofilum ochraceum TaxID=1611323 RepID=UPI0009F54A95|nr:hypothetical protein [Halofilum ochraceum]
MDTVTIPSRFKGPPKSANGGYVCGLMARRIKGDVAASLKIPPPLDTPIALTESGGTVEMHLDDRLVGRAQAAELDLEVPAMPAPLRLGGDPVDAPGRPVKFAPFSTCFVCGKDRQHPDGLCIHPQQVEGHEGMVAAPWRLHEGLGDAHGRVATEFLWAALDCPGYFACAPGEAALLARLTVSIGAPLRAEGEATVLGWDLSGAGRKRRCGTAIFAPDGSLVARAEGLWVVVDPSSITA